MSLCLVLIFLLFAFLLLGGLFSRLWWAQEAAAVGERQIRNGEALISLTEVGRRWLQTKVASGSLPRKSRLVPTDFSGVRLLQHTEEGRTLEVYDLNYDPDKVPDDGWGARGFFPPCPGAFLIRTSGVEGGMERRHETIVTLRTSPDGSATLDERPLLWQEVWP